MCSLLAERDPFAETRQKAIASCPCQPSCCNTPFTSLPRGISFKFFHTRFSLLDPFSQVCPIVVFHSSIKVDSPPGGMSHTRWVLCPSMNQPPPTLPRVLGPWIATAIIIGTVIG